MLDILRPKDATPRVQKVASGGSPHPLVPSLPTFCTLSPVLSGVLSHFIWQEFTPDSRKGEKGDQGVPWLPQRSAFSLGLLFYLKTFLN